MIRKRGFSLLEIMIVLSIGLLVFLGMFEVFNAARQGYRYTQGIATIQENGQLASYILTHELSQAGYVGCRKLDNAFVVASHGESNIGLTTLIHGYTQRTLPSTQKIIA
ncbi:MAG: PilW family protein, partial [Gammaproteobacteria bacterium]